MTELKDKIENREKKEMILKQLDSWIEESDKMAVILKGSNMITSQMCSNAMSQAYWNVKQFIEVNL